MQVTGPDWPSTRLLRDALASLETDLILNWGQGGKNGLEQLTAFKQAGILSPEFTLNLNEAKQWVRAGFKVFGRRLNHTQGSDIIGPGFRPSRQGIAGGQALKWITTRKGNRVQRMREVRGTRSVPEHWNRQWCSRDFWVKVIPSVNEYRQHVWNAKAIRVGKKVKSDESWRIQPVRSRNNGWHIDYGFQSESEEFKTKIRELAKRAVAAVDYVGGAVDILEGSDGQLYVLEVNSAPSLKDENTLRVYVEAITKWASTADRPRRRRQ